YYVGSTDNVRRRLTEHNELSENSYTSKFRPWELIAFFEVGESRSTALKIEKHIKKQKSKTYIEDILNRGSINGLVKKIQPS
ncbi:MAG: GIY-YIG nuclease family protein, partial [Prolixibacteraceae bacterium]|nr:GIY-YIG nuclease family protein [Prolixibacteraceae bacterium]